MATDPTTDPGSPEQSPVNHLSAGDRSVLADELLGPPPAVATPDDQDLGPDAASVVPGWVTLGDPLEQARHDPVLSPRRVFVQLALGVVAALLVVGVVGTLAARQLAEREAVNDAATIADVLAEAVVQPSLTDALLAGDPAAVAAFDQVARDHVLSDTVVRVKLWNADGKVLYADESQLVGRTFPLSDEQREALDQPATVADVSDLDESENAFESADKLVEVYRPVWTPSGQEVLFEIYGSYDPVGARTSQLWRGFAGVTASSLVLLVVVVSPIVWHLVRRLRRAQQQQTTCSSGPSTRRPTSVAGSRPACTTARCRTWPRPRSPSPVPRPTGRRATADGPRGRASTRRPPQCGRASARCGPCSSTSTRRALRDAGLRAALRDLAATQSLRGRRPARGRRRRCARQGEALVYGVAQECLRNAARHSRAENVECRCRPGRGRRIRSRGRRRRIGFDPRGRARSSRSEGHFGVKGHPDLAAAAGRAARGGQRPGRGTRWRLAVPASTSELGDAWVGPPCCSSTTTTGAGRSHRAAGGGLGIDRGRRARGRRAGGRARSDRTAAARRPDGPVDAGDGRRRGDPGVRAWSRTPGSSC